jgi:hypothetical protein
MILLLAYKVMYECRSIINGRWPCITCSSKNSEEFMSRIPYTWFGVLIGSFLFYFLSLYLLSVSSNNNLMILGQLCSSASCKHSLISFTLLYFFFSYVCFRGSDKYLELMLVHSSPWLLFHNMFWARQV